MAASAGLSWLSAGAMAISYPLYLHLLGYERYGLWLTLYAIVGFSQIGNLGISQAVAKQVAEELSRGKLDGVRECMSSAYAILGTMSILVVGLLWSCSDGVIRLLRLGGENLIAAHQLLPGIIVLSAYVFVVDLSNNFLNGLGRMDLCAACQTGSQLIALPVSLVLLYLNFGLSALLLANFIGYGVTHAIGLFLGRKLLKSKPFAWRAIRLYRMRALLGFGGWVFAGSILNMLLNPFNKGIIARYSGLASVPLYDIALNSAMRLRSVAESPQRSLMAEVSRLSALCTEAAYANIRRVYRTSVRMILYMLPLYVGVFLFAAPLLKLWLGSRYSAELPACLRITLIASFISLISTPAYYVLLGRGRATSVFVAFAVQSLLNGLLVTGLVLSGYAITAQNMLLCLSSGMVCASVYLLWREHFISCRTIAAGKTKAYIDEATVCH